MQNAQSLLTSWETSFALHGKAVKTQWPGPARQESQNLFSREGTKKYLRTTVLWPEDNFRQLGTLKSMIPS